MSRAVTPRCRGWAGKRWSRKVGLLLSLAATAACGGGPAESGLSAITERAFDAHLRFLSSDYLEGRAPGTRGSELAASYIANQFLLSGLEPAGRDGSYYQMLPLLARRPTSRLSFRAPGGASLTPEQGPEFVAWSADTAGVSIEQAELVFVGYGISAPEYGWDDYKDVDVAGKVVLILARDPGRWLAGKFRGDTATVYSFAANKYAEAARRGAVGAIVVYTSTLGYSWNAIRAVGTGEQLGRASAEDSSTLAFRAWVTEQVAQQVVTMAGLDFVALLETARSESFRPIISGVLVDAGVRNEVRELKTANVAGLLRGRDAELSDQVVVITAHYDHLGVARGVDGDSIYNGAVDNASGAAALLCLAEAFSRLTESPARSILFLAVTAEEAGMLGSRYYVEHPLVALGQTVANVNMDGVNLWGATEDIVVLAADISGLRSIVRRAADAENLEVAGDYFPDHGYLYRSDHFSFISAGVPAIYVLYGMNYIGRMPGWGVQREADYRRDMYHQLSDEYRADLDLRGAIQQIAVAFRISLTIANTRERPRLPVSDFEYPTGNRQ